MHALTKKYRCYRKNFTIVKLVNKLCNADVVKMRGRFSYFSVVLTEGRIMRTARKKKKKKKR